MNSKIKPERVFEIQRNSDIKDMVKEAASAIASNKLILFIGAGVPMNLGLPSWKKLVTDLLEEETNDERKKKLIPKQDLLRIQRLNEYGYSSDALESIKNLIATDRFAPLYEDELRDSVIKRTSNGVPEKAEVIKKKSRVYRLLAELYDLGAKKIVTTNYDKSIETCLNLKGVYIPENLSSSDKREMIEKDEYYIKLHGGLNHIGETVLFEEDYRKHYIRKDTIPDLLEELFTHNRILFLGCGLSDRFMDVYEKLKAKDAVLGSSVICLEGEMRNVAKTNSIRRIPIRDFSELEVIMDLLVLETKKEKLNSSRKVLFADLPVGNYNYSSAESFFRRISQNAVTSCYFFNTQVEFSAWFSPALQLHLSQQMRAYYKHIQNESGTSSYEHFRVLFLPFDKQEFLNKLADNEEKANIKATQKVHDYMKCNLVYITTDDFKDIIRQKKAFFAKTNAQLLKSIGLVDEKGRSLDRLTTKELGIIIQNLNDNGYRKINDLDFAVVSRGKSDKEIWQANYGKSPADKNFHYSTVKTPKKEAYLQFSDIIIDYLDNNKTRLMNPMLGGKKLKTHLNS